MSHREEPVASYTSDTDETRNNNLERLALALPGQDETVPVCNELRLVQWERARSQVRSQLRHKVSSQQNSLQQGSSHMCSQNRPHGSRQVVEHNL